MSRGQTSLELIIITGVVVALSFLFTSYYTQTQPTTTALVIAKNELTLQLQQQTTPALVDSITTQTNGNELTLLITTVPMVTNPLSDWASLNCQIRSKPVFPVLNSYLMEPHNPAIVTPNADFGY